MPCRPQFEAPLTKEGAPLHLVLHEACIEHPKGLTQLVHLSTTRLGLGGRRLVPVTYCSQLSLYKTGLGKDG